MSIFNYTSRKTLETSITDLTKGNTDLQAKVKELEGKITTAISAEQFNTLKAENESLITKHNEMIKEVESNDAKMKEFEAKVNDKAADKSVEILASIGQPAVAITPSTNPAQVSENINATLSSLTGEARRKYWVEKFKK